MTPDQPTSQPPLLTTKVLQGFQKTGRTTLRTQPASPAVACSVESFSTLMQIAEGSLSDCIGRLARVRECIVALNDPTLVVNDLLRHEEEANALLAEVEEILTNTHLGESKLFTGGFSVDSVEVAGNPVEMRLRIPRIDLRFLGLEKGIEIAKRPHQIPLSDPPQEWLAEIPFRKALERYIDSRPHQSPLFAADTTATQLAALCNAELAPHEQLTTAEIESIFGGRFDPSVHVNLLNEIRTDEQVIGSLHRAMEQLEAIQKEARGCINRLESAFSSGSAAIENPVSPGLPDAELAKRLIADGQPLQNSALSELMKAQNAAEAKALIQLIR